MDPVVHFEMPGKDKDRMSKFYETAFGWQTHKLGKEMGEYVVVSTSESEPNGRPKMPGMINGGFYTPSADPASQYPSVVIGVRDLEASLAKVTAAGGQMHGEPYDIPGVGKYVSIIDTEGNRISLLQPNQM